MSLAVFVLPKVAVMVAQACWNVACCFLQVAVERLYSLAGSDGDSLEGSVITGWDQTTRLEQAG